MRITNSCIINKGCGLQVVDCYLLPCTLYCNNNHVITLHN